MLTKAREIGGETGDTVAAVALGPGASDIADQAGAYGAAKLYAWDDDAATDYVTLPMVEALAQAVDAGGAQQLLFPSSDFYKDVAARLAILGVDIPSQFLLMTPYIATMIVLAGVVGRGQMPAADGQPYEKE
jgi:electron transfer flavoprotein alpha subunit